MKMTNYLLTCLSEECAEVSQRCSKAIRFGMKEIEPGQDKDNMQRLKEEYNDLIAVAEVIRSEIYPNFRLDRELIDAKKKKLSEYMEYSRHLGALK